MPAAVQPSTICPSRQRVTLRLVVRAIEIIDSMGFTGGERFGQAAVDAEAGDGEHLLQPFAQRPAATLA